MAEIVGLGASIIAIIQLAGAVTTYSYGYLSGVKRAPSDLRALVSELGSLGKVLFELQNLVNKSPGPGLKALQTLNAPGGPLEEITEELKKLVAKLEPKKGAKVAMDSLKWPLKEAETMQCIARMERHKSLFVFALAADQISLSTTIEENLQDMSRVVEEIQLLAQSTNLTIQDINNGVQSLNTTPQDTGNLVYNTNMTLHGLKELSESTDLTTNEIKALTMQNTLTTADIKETTQDTNSVVHDIKVDVGHAILAIRDLQAGSIAKEAIRDVKKRRKVLDWLSLEDFECKHLEVSRRRQKNTGGWILREPQFDGWIKQRNENRLLWGYGIPGAGKTFLSSSIICHLQAQAISENYGVAHFYFDYKSQPLPIHVIASLAKQLAYQLPNLPSEIEDLHNKREYEGKKPTIEELYSALVATTKLFDKAFLVFDAFDEYNQENLDQRGELLEFFQRMGQDGINVFLTSRPHPEDMQDALQGAARVEISAKEEDIRTYIKDKINKHPRAKRLLLRSKLEDRIITELVDCAQGMFLLVPFHVGYLCKQATIKQILAALETLKHASEQPLDAIYNQAMENLRKQDQGCIDLALRVLSFLVKARRTLTVDEIRIAVSVELDQSELDENALLDRSTILDICAGLVTIDEETMTVRLAHYTVQDYLLKASAILQDADFQVAMACVTYLTFDVFSEGACKCNDTLRARHDSHPFLEYAVHYLYTHLHSCDEDLSVDLVLTFLQNPGNINTYLQTLHFPENSFRELDYDIYSKGRQPLHVAVTLGHATAVLRLLDDGDDISAPDDHGQTALHAAASGGQEAMVRLLLDQGADISLPNRCGQTALHMASYEGHTAVVQALLERGTDLSSQDILGCTALHNAAFELHIETIQLLLDHGANMSAEAHNGRTVLHTAAYRGNEAVARLLLENGADHSIRDINGQTVLNMAAYKGQLGVTKLLLGKGANPCAPGAKGSTALHLVITAWCKAKSQLKYSPEDNSIAKRYKAVAEQLLLGGAGDSILDSKGVASLKGAVFGEDPEVLQLLVEKGPDLSSSRDCGGMLLLRAVYGGYPAAVRLLLEKGADSNYSGSDGQTALHIAASQGYEEAVRVLLEHEVDTSLVDSQGYTALDLAMSRSYSTIVNMLTPDANCEIEDWQIVEKLGAGVRNVGQP